MGGAEQGWVLTLYEEALLLASSIVRETGEEPIGNSLGFHSSQILGWDTQPGTSPACTALSVWPTLLRNHCPRSPHSLSHTGWAWDAGGS